MGISAARMQSLRFHIDQNDGRRETLRRDFSFDPRRFTILQRRACQPSFCLSGCFERDLL